MDASSIEMGSNAEIIESEEERKERERFSRKNQCLRVIQAPTTGNERCKIILSNSVIKGYHHYKIKPPITTPETNFNIDREYTNRSDEDACLVWIPDLDHFNVDLHIMVTDLERNLYLSDIAGLPFGHVPCKLASCFRYILDSGGEVSATVKGGPVPSFPPWPLPTDKDGGVVIPCSYSITVDNIETAVSKLKDTLSQMPEGNAMEIVIL